MVLKKPVTRRKSVKDCEACLFKSGDFSTDPTDPNVIRVYCRARHAQVNAELMSHGECDFWKMNPDYEDQTEKKNTYGL